LDISTWKLVIPILNMIDMPHVLWYLTYMDKKKILIVEDDEWLRDLYLEVLSQEGYDVDTAEDGPKGLKKAEQGGWDLILLDIVLPEMNGFEIMRNVKKDLPAKPAKKIIFMTNLYADAQNKEALALGDGYIIKAQITPDNLVTKVKEFLAEGKSN